MTHPKNIIENKELYKKMKHMASFYDYDFLDRYFNKLGSHRWMHDNYFDFQLASPTVWFLQSHYAYRDFCRVQFPKMNLKQCALAMFFSKK